MFFKKEANMHYDSYAFEVVQGQGNILVWNVNFDEKENMITLLDSFREFEGDIYHSLETFWANSGTCLLI